MLGKWASASACLALQFINMHNVRCYGRQCSEFCFPLSPVSVTNFIDFQFHVTFGVCSRTLDLFQSNFLLQSWVNLCHIKHAAAARSSSSTWGAALCFSVRSVVLHVWGDIWWCTAQPRVQIADIKISRPAVASCHNTLYSRPGLKVAPQLLMHLTHVVLRT